MFNLLVCFFWNGFFNNQRVDIFACWRSMYEPSCYVCVVCPGSATDDDGTGVGKKNGRLRHLPIGWPRKKQRRTGHVLWVCFGWVLRLVPFQSNLLHFSFFSITIWQQKYLQYLWTPKPSTIFGFTPSITIIGGLQPLKYNENGTLQWWFPKAISLSADVQVKHVKLHRCVLPP